MTRAWLWSLIALGGVSAILLAFDAARSPYGPMSDLPSCVPAVMIAIVPDGVSPDQRTMEAAIRDAGLEHLRGGTYMRVLPEAAAPSVASSTAPVVRADTDEDSGAESGAPEAQARIPAFLVMRPARRGPHAEQRVELIMTWTPLGLGDDDATFSDFRRTAVQLAGAVHGHVKDLASHETVTGDDLARRYEAARACARELRGVLGLPDAAAAPEGP